MSGKMNMRRLMHAAGCALAVAGSTHVVHAEVDVLQRPAMLRTAARASVLLDLARAGQHWVAVGEGGVILRSDSQGKNWQQMAVPVSVTLTSVAFSDAQNGWAAGHSGVVLGTSDGGQHWTLLLDGVRAAALVQAELQQAGAAPERLAEAARLVAEGADKPFLDVAFTDRQHGWAVGAYGLIFATEDGGKSWSSMRQQIDNPAGLHLYAMQGDARQRFLVGEHGAVLMAQGASGHFGIIKTPYQGSYFGLLQTAGKLLVFGMRGHAYWSADQGASWQQCSIPVASTLTAGTVLADGRVVLVDDAGSILLSEDGGRGFRALAREKLAALTAVQELAPGQLLLAGARGIEHVQLASLQAGRQP